MLFIMLMGSESLSKASVTAAASVFKPLYTAVVRSIVVSDFAAGAGAALLYASMNSVECLSIEASTR